MLSQIKCLECGHTTFSNDDVALTCLSCHESYVFKHYVLDTLNHLSPSTKKELTGMAMENGLSAHEFEKFKVRFVEDPRSLTKLLSMTENDHNQYYQQTLMNYQSILEHCQDLKGKKVLEIGSCHDYYFLRPFKDKGAECVALNIHFDLPVGTQGNEWPLKVLADMNAIPFQNNTFDYIVISATSHHSNTPEVLINEIYRVLKQNGKCFMINDPIDGLIKKLGGNFTQMRHDHINENEYTIGRYNTAFKLAGFRIQHLFSAYHDHKLLSAKISSKMRFAFIAKLLCRVWKVSFVREICKRHLLWFAQYFFGFPLNVVLIKK